MRRTLSTLVTLALLSSVAASASPQETPAETSELVEQAVALGQSDGPAAAIELLESTQAQRGLQDEEQALLGMLLFTVGRADESYATLEPLSRSEDASPAVLFNAWRAAEATGRGMEQLDLLERSAAAAPISPAARQLGFIRGNQNRLQEAFVLLVPWARAQPEDTEARLAAAHAALQLSRVPVAEEMLSDLPQDLPQVRLLWGKALFLRGDPYGALATLKALGDGSDLPPGIDQDRRHTMANAYIGIGEAAKAVELLEGRVDDDPRLVMVLGRAQSQIGMMPEALTTLRPLAEAVLADAAAFEEEMAAGVLLDFGRALIATGSHAEAIEPLQQASELDPDNEMVWQSLGQALAVSGRREEAAAALEHFQNLAQNAVPVTVRQSTLERDVDDPTARQLRESLTLAGQGQLSAALEVVQSERRMSPGDPRAPLVESQILVMLERPEDALRAAEDTLVIAPDFADGYYQQGVVLMSLNRLKDAETSFHQALEIAPGHTPAMNDLAVLLMVLERNDEARQLLEQVLELNPEDELAAANLASLDG